MKNLLTAGAALYFLAASAPAQQQPQQFSTETQQRAFLNQYCAYCHNDTTKSGQMSLTKLDLTHITHNGDLPEKMIRKLNVGLMPPPGMPRPKPEVIRAFAGSLESEIDHEAALHPNPGR